MLTPDPTNVQQAVGPRYEVLDLFSTGGMGAVYRARHRTLGHVVAIKVLPPEIAASKVREARFRREAQLAAHLSHPNVVPVYEFETREGITYLIMPFVRGRTLEALLGERIRLSLPELLRILTAVGAALDFIHPRGVVHRDVKPANILIEDETDRAFLADFGVALAGAGASSLASSGDSTLTGIGEYVGTPAYSPPEQLVGAERVDGRADLFALALVAFQALTGELPAAGRDRVALAAALHQRRGDVPAALATALVAPLAAEPHERPPSAAAWLAKVGESRRRYWRRPAMVAAVGVLATAVIAIAQRSFQTQMATEPERSLAMMPFTMLGTSPELLPSQLPSFFLQRLGSVPDLSIVPLPKVTWLTGTRAQVISEAESAAVQLNATYFVQPSLELEGKRARLGAQVYDTRSGKLLATGRQEGSADSLSYLMDAVWAQVLPAVLRRNFAPVSSMTLPRGLGALLAYASAEEAFRGGDYAGALADYDDVIAADSTFALAHFRRALVVAQVDPREESFRGAIAGARRHQSGLAPADSLLLDGYSLLLDRGDGRGALQSFKAAADLAPDAPLTWLVLGEFYFHFGAIFDEHISGAEDAFNRVRDLTPTSAPAIAHLISLAHLRGDKQATAHLIAEYEAFNTQSVVAEAVGIADTLLLRGLPARAALMKTLDRHSFTALQFLAFQAEQFGSAAERAGPARQILRALERRATTDSQLVLALRLGVGADLGEGWTDSARARLARVHTPATERERDRWLVLLAAVGRDSLGGWREAADRLGRSPGNGEMEHWMLARLGRDRASHIAALERLAADSSPLPLSLKLDLDARRALAAGDTVRALQLWQQATERYAVLRVPFGLVASLWWLRLDMARVAVAHGDTALARRTCDSFASLIGYVDMAVRAKSTTLCAP
jgi:serine/threonine protein kinase/tetratricopeptide (TPR) repeat protein